MLEKQQILVFGAAGKLGQEVVNACLQQGASVIAVDVDNKGIAALNSRFKAAPNFKIECVDVNDAKAANSLFDGYSSSTGLVNCTYPRNASYGRSFLDVTLTDFNENVSLQLGGAFQLMQAAVHSFLQSPREFSLVNVASIYGVVAPRFEVYDGTKMTMPVEYAAVKSALLHLSSYVNAYVQDSRFRVNTVSPGGILEQQPESFLQAYAKHTRGKGMLNASDICGSIVFLLSEMAACVCNQNIIVDDGFCL
ncbi:SDR family oxidoreductase [Aestuariibacter halophilus]|uniref:SDR family oxidoreductase n=1 Tax=Fluctibacter halophilus TaxID=226011 RepID=A0ABS8G4R8_9ALTE|nr:oxidoreductase [Aestuariibacter halophilus]MCC2615131.1 SDR family oxidoreductase [Aestuariibacter halophilus]